MTDRYIDYFEVSEYGNNFCQQAVTLVGASDLCAVDKVIARVLGAVLAVEAERDKAGMKRSALRTGRGDTAAAEEQLRGQIRRFYHHLHSLPETVVFDFEAFFPGKQLNDLTHLKSADLQGRAADVLRGFNAEINKPVADFASWRKDLEAAHAALAEALGGKGGAVTNAVVATSALIKARSRFLEVYNGVAKPMIRGVLNDLGRGDQMRLFFKDLAVNEGGRKGGGAEEEAPTPPAGMPDDGTG
jgi:hypothetical protein